MQDDTADTETLVALVLSLLPSKSKLPTSEVVLDTLIEYSGDVQLAASRLKSLSSGSEHVPNRKRKLEGKLDSWLRGSIPLSVPESSSSAQSDSHVHNRRYKPLPTKKAPTTSAGNETSPADLMQVLKQPHSPKKARSRLSPLMLSTPALVAQYTPCTLHLSVLPPELACRLFYVMVDASKQWQRNKWWLFDRLVESPHKTSFFVRKNDGFGGSENWHQAAQYWYNGRKTDSPPVFLSEMEQACQIVEKIVSEQLTFRRRYDMEWGGDVTEDHTLKWRANVAASNCYEGASEGVGYHSDQLTYLGPYPTIASLSLGTRRTFSLREVIPADEVETRQARTFNIPVPHNSLAIMHASCQETFKHSIPPQTAIDLYHPAYPRNLGMDIDASNCRINITFRFYRPDFRPESIPKCKCGVPTVLRPDMKNRSNDRTGRYWWSCYAGAQKEGKGCSFWKVLNMVEEKRGPCLRETNAEHESAV